VLPIASRKGCDLNPLHIQEPEQRERLLAYVWPEQSERVARAEAALKLVAKNDLEVEAADAAIWLEQQFLTPLPEGRTQVLYHSVFWQYLPEATKQSLQTLIANRGRMATSDTAFAWLRYEADPGMKQAELVVSLWPGGKPRKLASCDFHGKWAQWEIT
jgi:hypothetical protein